MTTEDELDIIKKWNDEHPDATDEEEETYLKQRGWVTLNLTGDRSVESIAAELARVLGGE